MYANTSKAKPGLKWLLKRPLVWCILFAGAVLPGRARVVFCELLHKANYKQKGKETVGERLSNFFYDK